MKKLIALLLSIAAALPLFTACEVFGNTSGDTSDTYDITSGGTANTDEIQPAEEEYDPTKDEYSFKIFAKGDYITDPIFDTDEFLPKYDVDYNAIVGCPYTYAAGDAIYFVEKKTIRGKFVSESVMLISCMDRATGNVSVLCSDPECEHTDNKCRACIKTYSGSYSNESLDYFTMYDGKLFWIIDGTIYSMNPDGTEKKFIRSVGTEDMNGGWGYYAAAGSAVIHRGYAYFYGHNLNGQDGKDAIVLAVPLDGDEQFTIFQKKYDEKSKYGQPTSVRLKCIGDDVYVMIVLNKRDESAVDKFVNRVELYRWSTKTRSEELVYAGSLDEKAGESFVDWGAEFYPVPGDGVYLMKEMSERDGYDGFRTLYKGVCKYSFKTGEIEHVSWLEHEGGYVGVANITDKYIVSSCGAFSYLFDHEGNLLRRSDPIEDMDFPGVENLFPDYPDNGFITTSRTVTVLGIYDDQLICQLSVSVTEPDPPGSLYIKMHYHSELIVAIPFDGGEITVLSPSVDAGE